MKETEPEPQTSTNKDGVQPGSEHLPDMAFQNDPTYGLTVPGGPKLSEQTPPVESTPAASEQPESPHVPSPEN